MADGSRTAGTGRGTRGMPSAGCARAGCAAGRPRRSTRRPSGWPWPCGGRCGRRRHLTPNVARCRLSAARSASVSALSKASPAARAPRADPRGRPAGRRSAASAGRAFSRSSGKLFPTSMVRVVSGPPPPGSRAAGKTPSTLPLFPIGSPVPARHGVAYAATPPHAQGSSRPARPPFTQ